MTTTTTHEGWRGLIHVEEVDGVLIATKQAKHDQARAAINKEAHLLEKLTTAKIDFVPQITEKGDGWFSYPWIEGTHFKDAWKEADKTVQQRLAIELLDKAYQLDRVGVVHGELIRPYTNVLVTPTGSVAIIDFERGQLGDSSGKNMRSLSQWYRAEGLLSIEQCKYLGHLNCNEMFGYLRANLVEQKKHQKRNIIISGVLILLIVDQVTKRLFYDDRIREDLWLFTPSFNTGIGRSLPVPLQIVLILTLLIVGGVIRLWHRRELPTRFTILIVAGALGNGIDRLRLGGVRDFIDLHVWPIFNIADSYLSIAVVAFILLLLVDKKGTESR